MRQHLQSHQAVRGQGEGAALGLQLLHQVNIIFFLTQNQDPLKFKILATYLYKRNAVLTASYQTALFFQGSTECGLALCDRKHPQGDGRTPLLG